MHLARYFGYFGKELDSHVKGTVAVGHQRASAQIRNLSKTKSQMKIKIGKKQLMQRFVVFVSDLGCLEIGLARVAPPYPASSISIILSYVHIHTDPRITCGHSEYKTVWPVILLNDSAKQDVRPGAQGGLPLFRGGANQV